MDIESTDQKIEKTQADLKNRASLLVGCQARLRVFQEALQSLPQGGTAAKKIEEKIDQERAEESQIEKSLVELEAIKSALEDIKRILTKPDKHFSLRPTSELFRVEQFIRSRGGPTHLDDIMRGIGVEGEEKKKSLRGSLRAYARDGKIFENGPMLDSFSLIGLKESAILNGSGGANEVH